MGQPQPLTKKDCKHCGSSFTTTSKAKHYCSAKCQDSAKSARYRRSKKETQLRRYDSKADKWVKSSFGRYLIGECLRAGTVQILQGHNVETLQGLEKLYRYRQKASGYVEGKSKGVYHLSHIYPVANGTTGRLGLLHPDNLVVAPASLNQKHGSKSPDREDFGKFIAKATLQSRFDVSKETTHKEVFKKIKSLLDTAWMEYVATAVVQATQADQLRKKLEKLIGLKLPESHYDLEALKQLAKSKDVDFFQKNFNPYDPLEVFQHELERFGHGKDSGGEFSTYAKWIDRFNDSFDFLRGYRKDLTESDEKALEAFLAQEIFNGLHGLWVSSSKRPEETQAVLNKFLKPLEPLKVNHSDIDVVYLVDEYADCPL